LGLLACRAKSAISLPPVVPSCEGSDGLRIAAFADSNYPLVTRYSAELCTALSGFFTYSEAVADCPSRLSSLPLR
jgi:hypothetical protein